MVERGRVERKRVGERVVIGLLARTTTLLKVMRGNRSRVGPSEGDRSS